jgi:hypothetical protein
MNEESPAPETVHLKNVDIVEKTGELLFCHLKQIAAGEKA